MSKKIKTELSDILQDGTSDSPDTPTSSGPNREESSDRPKKSRRTFLTQSACKRCRQKKSKCDGSRPICARCEKHGTECVYDVAQEGLTRMQHLQQQLDLKSLDNDRLRQLLATLSEGTDHDATTILARLRMGVDLDGVLVSFAAAKSALDVQHGSAQPQDEQPSEDVQSWPPVSVDNEPGPGEDSIVVSSSDERLRPHRKSDPSNRFHTFEPPDDMHRPEPLPNFSSVQWQMAYAGMHGDSKGPSRSSLGGPYYGMPDRSSGSAVPQDQQPQTTLDDPRSRHHWHAVPDQREGFEDQTSDSHG